MAAAKAKAPFGPEANKPQRTQGTSGLPMAGSAIRSAILRQRFVYRRMFECDPVGAGSRGIALRVFARLVLVSMIVASGLGLVGCTLIDELQDTVSKLTSLDTHAEKVPDATGSIPAKTPPTNEATKASIPEKRSPAREMREPRTARLPTKQPSSAPAQPAISQEAAAPPSQSAPSLSPWPKAPAPGNFSR
jgi:hypothetical protein